MNRTLLLVTCLCALSLVLNGCKSHPDNSYTYDPGYVYAKSSLPYVADVQFPETIIADEPFEVKLTLYADLHPEYLHGVGLANTLWRRSHRFHRDPEPAFVWGGDGVIIETWFSIYRNEDNTTHVVIIDAPSSNEAVFLLDMPAGDWVLHVSSADTPEQGGLEDRIQVIPSFRPPDNPHVVYKDYPFTVMPKPEGGA